MGEKHFEDFIYNKKKNVMIWDFMRILKIYILFPFHVLVDSGESIFSGA